MMKSFFLAAALASTATLAAAADNYVLDASHSQIVFSYNHLGYSTTYGMFSGLKAKSLLTKKTLQTLPFLFPCQFKACSQVGKHVWATLCPQTSLVLKTVT